MIALFIVHNFNRIIILILHFWKNIHVLFMWIQKLCSLWNLFVWNLQKRNIYECGITNPIYKLSNAKKLLFDCLVTLNQSKQSTIYNIRPRSTLHHLKQTFYLYIKKQNNILNIQFLCWNIKYSQPEYFPEYEGEQRAKCCNMLHFLLHNFHNIVCVLLSSLLN